MDYWKSLECDECCYTCEFNKNHLKKNTSCECEKVSQNKDQDIYCGHYEMCSDYGKED